MREIDEIRIRLRFYRGWKKGCDELVARFPDYFSLKKNKDRLERAIEKMEDRMGVVKNDEKTKGVR